MSYERLITLNLYRVSTGLILSSEKKPKKTKYNGYKGGSNFEYYEQLFYGNNKTNISETRCN